MYEFHQSVLFNAELISFFLKYKQLFNYFGRIYVSIRADIISCSKGSPSHDSNTRMFPAIHVLVSHLNIKHFFKNICRYETKLGRN